MPLPEVKRVLYEKNPLERVICQLRYPPILKIDSELPSEFQDKIRSVFPEYNQKIEFLQEVTQVLGKNSPQSMMQEVKKPLSIKNHNFATEDGVWQLNLTRTFLSITTTKYTRWEEFLRMFNDPINSLIRIYNPPFFTRIGLRYVDIFDRTKLGLADVPWEELISPQFLGLMLSDIGKDITNFESKYEMKLDDGVSVLRIITTFVENITTKDKCFLIDGDFYLPIKTSIDSYNDRLEFLHDHAIRLIQFMIKKRLHEAMKPSDLK